MLSLLNYLRPTTARAPLTTEIFVFNVVPPVICYFITAFLVLLPRTKPIRVALWPVTAVLAFRASGSLDMSMARPKLGYLNIDLQLCMFWMAIRALEWTLHTTPLTRPHHYQDGRLVDVLKKNIMLDALDLAFSLRGCGWDWSRGLYVPRETRPTSSKVAFVTSTLLSSLSHAFICGAIHSAIKSFSPDTFGSVDGGTIFDDSLPPHLRYLRSSIIATLCAFAIYSALRACYEFLAVSCVLLFRHSPSQWPPAFDSPWRATSLRDFWSRRWHQWLRQMFIFLGGRPFSMLFGRIGGIIGAFLASGLFHHIALLPLGRTPEIWYMILPFGMMGVGVILERAVSGGDVGGRKGWIWTMCWMVLWGNLLVDGWARSGMLGGLSILDGATSVRQPIEWLARTFDEYLRAR